MKTHRPLGWWDTGRASAQPTKRFHNSRGKILALLTAVNPPARAAVNPPARVAEMVHRLLNLAGDMSQRGDEYGAKQIEKRITRALEAVRCDGPSAPVHHYLEGDLSGEISASAEAVNPSTAGADAPASQPKEDSGKSY